MKETDIPCSDCGSDLVEETRHVRELPISTSWQGRIELACCRSCGARYFPEQALTQLAGATSDPRPRGDC